MVEHGFHKSQAFEANLGILKPIGFNHQFHELNRCLKMVKVLVLGFQY